MLSFSAACKSRALRTKIRLSKRNLDDSDCN
jgi:hypothetical protein